MSERHLKDLLKTICEYNTTDITHTINNDSGPLITVSCVKNTSTLVVHYHAADTTQYFDTIEEAAHTINALLKQHSLV